MTARARPRNQSAVRRPRWTGDASDFAVLVSRGEPRRSDEQFADAIADQVREYLTAHPPWLDPGQAVPVEMPVLHALAARIAGEYGRAPYAQAVVTREHLLVWLGVVTEQRRRDRERGLLTGCDG